MGSASSESALEFSRERLGRRMHARWVRRAGSTLVALEVSVLGGFEMYGYLAVECTPSPEAEGIDIRISADVGEAGFVPTLAPLGDAVEPGLPEEFAGAVVDGLRRSAAFHALPAGHVLNVVSAAHAFAGSNQLIFSRIAWSAVAMLGATPDELTDAYFDRMLGEMGRPLPSV